jgi:hypothetical protein
MINEDRKFRYNKTNHDPTLAAFLRFRGGATEQKDPDLEGNSLDGKTY